MHHWLRGMDASGYELGAVISLQLHDFVQIVRDCLICAEAINRPLVYVYKLPPICTG